MVNGKDFISGFKADTISLTQLKLAVKAQAGRVRLGLYRARVWKHIPALEHFSLKCSNAGRKG